MKWKSWKWAVTRRITILVATYDWWFGGYYDVSNRCLYLMVPFIGLKFDFGVLRHENGWFMRERIRTWMMKND